MANLSIGAENVIDPVKEKELINESVKDAQEINLSDEEKQQIEEASSKKQEVKEELLEEPKKVVASSEFGSIELSSDEMKFCEELQQDLSSFIEDKANITTSSGYIERLPTGIDVLDAILGGGFGVGTFSMIVGNPGTFKSALVGQLIGTCQRKNKGKLLASYLDSENATTMERLSNLGAKYPPIKPLCENITVEKMFKTIECHCSFKALKEMLDIPSIVAWDSVANTGVEKQLASENDDINSIIGLKARILSILLPKYISKMNQYNVSLIAVNQLREKLDLGMFQSANDMKWMGDKTIPGGQALKYNAFHLLLLTIRGDIKFEQYGFNGVRLECKCIKNKFFQPNVPITLLVNFNTGISNFWTNYDFLVKTKRLASGAWNKLNALPEKKFRTKDAEGMYHADKDFKKVFDEQVKEGIQVEFLDMYQSSGS